MTQVTPEKRAHLASIAKLGGLSFAAQNDVKPFAAKGRAAFQRGFAMGHGCSVCPRIDIDPSTPEEERGRRAEFLFRLHMSRIARRR